MGKKGVAADFNGTIISYKDEGKLWKSIGMKILGEPWHLESFARAIPGFFKVSGLMEDYKAGRIDYDRIYSAFFSDVISGMPFKRYIRLANRYADDPRTLAEVDEDLLDCIGAARTRGSKTGVFSTGYVHTIERMLDTKGSLLGMDFIEANDVIVDGEGRVVDFYLDHFMNKGEHLPGILERNGLDPYRTVYIGDGPEDEGCFEVVGYQALSKHADDGFREQFSRRYPDGFVIEDDPRSYKDLDRFIERK